jgi:hypothetical protein
MGTRGGDPLPGLIAKQEIRDALSRYCRAMDRRDEPLAAATWHPDGTADYGEGIFTGTGAGFATWVTEIHAGFDRTSHQITNVLCEVRGEHAVSEAYVIVALWSTPDESGAVTQVTSRGRYLDRWSLRDGRWAVDERNYIEDFTTYQRFAKETLGGASARSRRDHDDPSYALLSSLL